MYKINASTWYNTDTMIKLNHKCKKFAFCWFLLHMNITMHRSKNVKCITLYLHSYRFSLKMAFKAETCSFYLKGTQFLTINTVCDIFGLLGLYAAYSGNCLPTFRDNLSCTETSVTN
jgi:hypothetical protein